MRPECYGVVVMESPWMQVKMTVVMEWPGKAELVNRVWMGQVPVAWEEAAVTVREEVGTVAS